MSKTWHRIFISLLVTIVISAFFILFINGLSYYKLSLEERVYNPEHNILKPSGIVGHGIGIIGSGLMLIGVASYMARKRYRFLSRAGILKYWLEFHIFLCTLGPILILFHTSFKFGGLVAISFWSMVAVFLSGIIGRFIYIQIPRTIEGRELTLSEVRGMKKDIASYARETYNLDEETYTTMADSMKRRIEIYHKNPVVRNAKRNSDDRKSLKLIKNLLKRNNLPRNEFKKIINLVKEDIKLNRKIERLDKMQNLFKYWHVAHSPFALVMIIIMIIHVAVTILFGYRWIF